MDHKFKILKFIEAENVWKLKNFNLDLFKKLMQHKNNK